MELVKQGNYIHTVCKAAGIDEATYHRWRERGAKGELPYREFCGALTRAEQEGVTRLVGKIDKAADFDWRAAAFLLERKHKKDWGRHETATVSTQLAEDINRRLIKGRELNAQWKRDHPDEDKERER